MLGVVDNNNNFLIMNLGNGIKAGYGGGIGAWVLNNFLHLAHFVKSYVSERLKTKAT